MNLAQVLADFLNANCDGYFRGHKSRDEWSAEQHRLWRIAAERCIAADVLRKVWAR